MSADPPFWADRLIHAVGAQHLLSEDARALVRPGAPAELVDVVRIASEVGATVGVGLGVDNRAGIDVDLSRMCNVLHLDETSLVVSVQAGIVIDALEQLLAEHALSLGPLPPWSRVRTLGQLLAAPLPSEASPRSGRFVQQCVGIAAILPDGSEIATRLAPRKATGPDLMHAIVGARGTLGLITAATVRVQRRQETLMAAAFRLPTLPAALSAARALLVRGGRPVDMMVSASGTLSLHTDGPEPVAAAEVALAERTARELGGEPVAYLPAPLTTTRPYERALPLETIDTDVLAPKLPGRSGSDGGAARSALGSDDIRIVGWHVAGACLVDSAREPAPPPAEAPLVAALKRRLDPHRRFLAWPGAH